MKSQSHHGSPSHHHKRRFSESLHCPNDHRILKSPPSIGSGTGPPAADHFRGCPFLLVHFHLDKQKKMDKPVDRNPFPSWYTLLTSHSLYDIRSRREADGSARRVVDPPLAAPHQVFSSAFLDRPEKNGVKEISQRGVEKQIWECAYHREMSRILFVSAERRDFSPFFSSLDLLFGSFSYIKIRERTGYLQPIPSLCGTPFLLLIPACPS